MALQNYPQANSKKQGARALKLGMNIALFNYFLKTYIFFAYIKNC